jgi:hypothetical protein
MTEHEDLFRWCVHCGADCWPDREDQEHAADCPAETGVWPVEVDEALEIALWVQWECDTVPDEIREMAQRAVLRQPVCAECEAPFRPGDFYMLRDDATGEIHVRPHIGVMVCIGCAAVKS